MLWRIVDMGDERGVAMSAKGILGTFLGPVAKLLVGGGGKKKEVEAPKALPTPTRNLAAEAAMQNDVVAKRKGILENLLTGASGEEAEIGKKLTLGS